MTTGLDDVAFLARSEHRIAVLDALSDNPRSRDELRSATGASSPTLGRVLADFEERRWVRRTGRDYVSTQLGTFVCEQFADLRDAMERERKLRPLVDWLPREMEGFTPDLLADPVISYPGPGYPYEPIDRVTALIEGTDRMVGFGTTIVKSRNLEAACDAIIDGMEFEFVYTPAVLETVLAWNPEKVARAATCDNCTTFVHDDLPDAEWCGLGIYGDRVGICCHDSETGTLTAAVDTDSPSALAWAESQYERYRDEARVVSADALSV